MDDETHPADGARDPGLFGPGSVTWRVHADPAMALAGFRALLLQAVHPVVMAGFDDNSVFRADPWGRLRRTGEFLTTVAFGTTAEAEAAGARLRAVHAALAPVTDPVSGRRMRIDDPELLLWVHCTEVESFLSTYRRSGGDLGPGDADRYVDEMRTSARLVGLDPAEVPRTEAEIEAYYARIRPHLRVTWTARRNIAAGLVPPMPLWVRVATPAQPAWIALLAVAGGLLPRWARQLYGLPGLPTTDAAASVVARTFRSALVALPEGLAESPARRRLRARTLDVA